jgi:putative glutamine amidotransferase
VNSATTVQPVIGISAYSEPARWGPHERPAALLPLSYPEQVAAAGGIPVLLPPVPGIEAAIARLDALVLSGGGDVDPAGYGADRHPRTERVYPGRDRAERALLTAALAAGLPVLGICRGLQIINVSRGGTLLQHLPDVVGHTGHGSGSGTYGSHRVRIAPASKLGGILGGTDPGRVPAGRDRPGPDSDPPGSGLWLSVPTSHHQAIGTLGDGLVATAWAEDGTIEAVELDPPPAGGEFVLAVQWHPEAGDDPRLFQALIQAARDRRAASGKSVGAEPLDSRA